MIIMTLSSSFEKHSNTMICTLELVFIERWSILLLYNYLTFFILDHLPFREWYFIKKSKINNLFTGPYNIFLKKL